MSGNVKVEEAGGSSGSATHTGRDKLKDTTRGQSNKQTKPRRTTMSNLQGYDHKGDKEEIGMILALRSKSFNNKVVYSSFVKKIKNYIISNFYDAQDMIPILMELRDPTNDVLLDEPAYLPPKYAKHSVKLMLKQEQVKRHAKRLFN